MNAQEGYFIQQISKNTALVYIRSLRILKTVRLSDGKILDVIGDMPVIDQEEFDYIAKTKMPEGTTQPAF
jgi:hypothetical protein